MKTQFVCPVLLLVLASLSFAAETPEVTPEEKMFRESLEEMKQYVQLLETVTNEMSAENAKQKLKSLFEQSTKKSARIGKLPKELQRQLQKKYERDFEQVQKGAVIQIRRIQAIPAAVKVLRDVFPFNREREEARAKATRAQIRILDQALQLYFAKFGEYPTTLEELTKKKGESGPFVLKDSLVDPWGKPIHYDSKGLQNNKEKPDLWSEGSPNTGEPIGNWKPK